MADSLIGSILNRDPKREDSRDSIRVTGTVNGGYVAECAYAFDTPFFLQTAELVQDYGAQLAEVESHDARLRRIDQEANEREKARLFRGTVIARPEPDAESPEGIFRAAEAEAGEDAEADDG